MGVGWYKKEQWKLLRENSEDVEDLEDTYFEWEVNADESVRNLAKSEYHIEKIEIDVNELIDWCKKENCALNGESRSMFIAMKTKEKFQ